MKVKSGFLRFVALAVACLIGIGLVSYHYLQQQLKVEQEEIVREAVQLSQDQGKFPTNVQ
ncbi:MAG: hypothetical protein J7J65_04215 [Candidatus Korarchaeota archaeon]|nr:hypothetical protein [Candidatus Korarchaeota archaeon]